MEQIREALFALKMDVLRKRQLLAQLESLREQEQALQQRVSFLAEQMAAEQQDVERLEGRRLAATRSRQLMPFCRSWTMQPAWVCGIYWAADYW